MMRDLSAPGQKRAIRDLLQALFVAELLKPSRPLWIASAWISDIELLDNAARQFSALYPDWPAGVIRLSEVIRALLERGGEVIILSRDAPHNHAFARKMETLPGTRMLMTPEFHEKDIVGEHFLLSGSMNFTHSGITLNDEHLVYRCDAASIQERRLVMEEKWRGRL